MDWYPTPSYLLKRRVIIDFLRRHVRGCRVLEVGCGCGDLLVELDKMGYSGMGIDLSEAAVASARSLLPGNRFTVMCCSPENVEERFDIVIASEVLEHQQDDVAFLMRLDALLAEGGSLLLTVPAHMQQWGANDDLCGHVRRYGRDELKEKLAVAGFEDIVVYSYGVPVCNLMKPFYDRAIASSPVSSNQHEKTVESGGMRLFNRAAGLFRMLFNDVTMFPWYLLQRLFYSTDLGMGYFAAARKKERM